MSTRPMRFIRLLSLFLLFEKLAFTGNIAAVTLGDDVFAHGVNGFAGDDFGADRGLDGDLEHLARDEFAHLRNQSLAAFVGEVAVNDDGKGVDGLSGDEDVELDHGRFPIVGEMVVEGRVAAGDGFQAVVKVENDFVQRQFVVEHDARGADVFEGFLLAALFFDEGENSADVFLVGENGGEDDGLFDFGDFAGIEPAGRVVDLDHGAVSLVDLVAHAGGGGDEIEIELALETLLNDLHVKQTEEAAAETEAECDGAFGLEEKRGIVEAKFFEGFAQLRVRVGIDGVEPGEDHGLDFFEAGQSFEGGMGVVGDGVADLGVGDVLDVGDDEADFSGDELVDFDGLGGEDAESFGVESGAIPPEADAISLSSACLERRE